MAKHAQRKNDNATRKHSKALLKVARSYDDKIRQATTEAKNLVKTAEQTPRPRPLSKRDADYDSRAEAYKDVVDSLLHMQTSFRHLQESMAMFHEDVRQLKGSYVPKKMMAKLDYDFLTLEIAGGNMDVAMLKLVAEIGEARRAAVRHDYETAEAEAEVGEAVAMA